MQNPSGCRQLHNASACIKERTRKSGGNAGPEKVISIPLRETFFMKSYKILLA